jgi:hypothetical protein
MKFTSGLATVAILFAIGINNSDAASVCYNTGTTQLYEESIYHATRACFGYDGHAGAFGGNFGPKEKKSACVNLSSGHIIFEVQNLNDHATFNIIDDDCRHEIWTILQQCERGGTYEKAGWWFR